MALRRVKLSKNNVPKMRRVTGVKKKEDVTVQLIPADMPVAPPDPESEFANPDPGLSTGLFLGSPGKRALWSIQDRDSEF